MATRPQKGVSKEISQRQGQNKPTFCLQLASIEHYVACKTITRAKTKGPLIKNPFRVEEPNTL